MLRSKDLPLHFAPFTWFVAGGWAIDLFLGRQTRHHTDVDLGIFRKDQLALQEFLPDWSFSKIMNGDAVEWRKGERLSLPVHEVHANSPSGASIEILLAESRDSQWLYRRDPTIKTPISTAVVITTSGFRVLAPEIVLLFKSKNPREQDQADFENVRSRLSEEQVQWLLEAIRRIDKNHPWAAKLANELKI